jgi:hypothetical protein
MHAQRICAPVFRRARVLAGLNEPASLSTLNAARRAMGAGPLWGLPAAVGLVVGYAVAVLLTARAGVLDSPTDVLLAAGGAAAVLVMAASWSRGVDVNAWLEADPRHRRGSCQWLIWRGEHSGKPCLACLASMPARERRTWLHAAESPAVVDGWIGQPGPQPAGTDAAVRDAGSVRAGWLAWQLLPLGCLLAAVAQWTSKAPGDHRAALPFALATVVTAAVNLFLRPGAAHSDRSGALASDPIVSGSCESCRHLPGTVTVLFPDGVTFTVCAGCLAAGVHAPETDVATTGGAR